MISYTVFFVLALLTLAHAKIPGDVCHWKAEKCCYNWDRCGVVPRRTAHKHDCPYKKCKAVCVEHCFEVEGKEVCKKACKPHCHLVYATCITYKHYEYVKYCPKLSCAESIVTEGLAAQPKVVVSTIAKFVGKEK